MTQTQRDNAKERKKTSRMGKNVNNYGHWLGMIRQMGVDNGMTRKQAEDRFNEHTIKDMFKNQTLPKNAYEKLMKMTNEERAKAFVIDIEEQKGIVLSIVNVIHLMGYGDVDTSERLRLASKKLHYYQTEYKRLYDCNYGN